MSTAQKDRRRAYESWYQMTQRCTNPRRRGYDRYGGRGIKVCERWKSFENFYADMGGRPPKITLERNDSNKDYGPNNCRWATWKEQGRNRSSNTFIEFRGRVMTLVEAAEIAGVKYQKIFHRMRHGVTAAQALAQEIIAKR